MLFAVTKATRIKAIMSLSLSSALLVRSASGVGTIQLALANQCVTRLCASVALRLLTKSSGRKRHEQTALGLAHRLSLRGLRHLYDGSGVEGLGFARASPRRIKDARERLSRSDLCGESGHSLRAVARRWLFHALVLRSASGRGWNCRSHLFLSHNAQR